MMRRFFTIVLFFVTAFGSYAQDAQFSQYYAAPLYLNPAFAGTGSGHRFVANYRNQWPNIDNGFVTYAFSYDYNLQDLKSGVGLIAMADRAGSASLSSTTLGFVYSYKIQLSNKWILTPGLHFGYGYRDIDMNKLVFGDQLLFTNDGQVPTSDPSYGSLGSSSYFDFGTGILLYNSKFWVGFSAYHINEPNRSLMGDESAIPMKTSVHGGVKLPLQSTLFQKEKMAYIAPSFVYKSQGRFDQLDLGLHFLYQPVMVGLWYRGIPLKQNVADNISQDAVALILGLQFNSFEFGYSYDFTISELGPSSSGAHELSLKYDLEIITSSKTKKPNKFIPCPTFIRD
ncbi:MAG: type IX secretion system membrane protein PorP/SprF [Cyclobacteriaceae bacterium]